MDKMSYSKSNNNDYRTETYSQFLMFSTNHLKVDLGKYNSSIANDKSGKHSENVNILNLDWKVSALFLNFASIEANLQHTALFYSKLKKT